jgi:hypothetical protein
MTEADKRLLARELGYGSVEEMRRDFERAMRVPHPAAAPAQE